MKLEIGKVLGGLNAIVADDLKIVEIEGIGKAEISYANRRPGYVVVNRIETNPYSIETNQNILSLMKVKGIATKSVKIVRDKSGRITKIGMGDLVGFVFGLSDEQKKEIVAAHEAIYARFHNDLLAGRITITVSIVGCDFPHAVLNCGNDEKYKGLRMWDLMYQILEEEFHIYEAYKWLPNEKQIDGVDVTADVLKKISEIHDKREKAKAEIAEKFDEAKRTGKPVLMKTWVDECNDRDEDCDMDSVYLYAMPDGKKKIERHHNW